MPFRRPILWYGQYAYLALPKVLAPLTRLGYSPRFSHGQPEHSTWSNSEMTQTFLKTGFCIIAGTLLASISWGSIEHSVVTGDHALAVFVMGMMFFIVGKFFVDRWRPVYGPDAFHPDRLWKIPQTATRRGLWCRVGSSMLPKNRYTAIVMITASSARYATRCPHHWMGGLFRYPLRAAPLLIAIRAQWQFCRFS